MTGGTAVTITLSPVPAGVNGTDTKHYLYISGGSGSSEAVLITGGTATSGSLSGTITLTPGNNHSGAWTVSSANGGIAEAMQSIASTGGVVCMPSGSYTIYGPIGYLPNITFLGAGPTTILIPGSSTSVVFDGNVPAKGADEFSMVSDNVRFQDFLIDGHSFSGINSAVGIQGLTTLYPSQEMWHYFQIDIVNVFFNNVFSSILFQRSRYLNILNCKLYANSQITISDSFLDNAHGNAFSTNTLIDGLVYSWHAIVASSCANASMSNAVISLIKTEESYISNCNFSMSGLRLGPGPTGIAMAGGEDLSIVNCNMNNPLFGIVLESLNAGAFTQYAAFVKIVGTSIDSIYQDGIVIADGTSSTDSPSYQVQHVLIDGCFITDTIAGRSYASFVNVGTYAKFISFTGNIFRDIQNTSTQAAIFIGQGCEGIRFDRSNSFVNNSDVTSPAGGPFGTGVNINSAAPVSVYGLEDLRFTGFATNFYDINSSTVASAALVLPVGRRFVQVTGTTAITSIASVPPEGSVVTLRFVSSLTVSSGTNLRLNSNFVSTNTAYSTLTLYSNGMVMIEIARSAN